MNKLNTIQEQILDTRNIINETTLIINNSDKKDELLNFILKQDEALLESLLQEEKKELLKKISTMLPNNINNAKELITIVYGEAYTKKIDPFYIAEYFNIEINIDYGITDGIGKSEFFGEKIKISYKPTNRFRDKFTIAHELGHIFLHFMKGKSFCFIDTFDEMDTTPCNNQTYGQKLQIARLSEKGSFDSSYNILELEANQFAGELLVPKYTVEFVLKTIPKGKAINASILKDYFDVSNDVIRHSLYDYGLLNNGTIVDNLPNKNRRW